MTNVKRYALELHNEGADSPIVNVQIGSLKLVSLAAKEATEELTSNERFRVELLGLTENEEGGFESETLLGLTADGETVGDVLATRLRRLRTELKKSAEVGPAAGAAEHAGERRGPAEAKHDTDPRDSGGY